MEQKHTKLPWFAGTGGIPIKTRYVTDSKVRVICDTSERECTAARSIEEVEANAEFIVQACNSHYDLLEACKQTLECLNNLTTAEFELGEDKPFREMLSNAIAKAEGRDKS